MNVREAYQSARVGAIDAEEGDGRFCVLRAGSSGGVGAGCDDAGSNWGAGGAGAEGATEGPARKHGARAAEMIGVLERVTG